MLPLTDVQAPAVSIPTNDMFFSKTHPDRPDVNFLRNHFFREGRLSEEQAIYILQKGTDVLRKEPNLLEVDAPMTSKLDCRAIVNCLLLKTRMQACACVCVCVCAGEKERSVGIDNGQRSACS